MDWMKSFLSAVQVKKNIVKKEIVENTVFQKVRKIVSGGAERYNSVWNGLQQITEKDGFVYIHDGARPFVDDAMIERAYRCVEETKACVAGMPVKDTIKVVDEKNYVKGTPERKTLGLVQTPQVFNIQLIKEAYQKLINEKIENATDDAMVVEQMMGHTVKLYPGAYENIKKKNHNTGRSSCGGSCFCRNIQGNCLMFIP